MQLYYSTSSPYARKARVVLREKGLLAATREIETNPYSDPAALLAHNRLGKVPTLVADDGTALYDSPVICEYLDARGDQPRLLPARGPERWNVLRVQALADGVLDLAVPLTLEKRRPEDRRSAETMARWEAQIGAALDVMADEVAALGAGPTLGHLACAVALGYLDFRHEGIGWRNGRSALADWYAGMADRPTLQATTPTDASYGKRTG